jgi:hypothetical protein
MTLAAGIPIAWYSIAADHLNQLAIVALCVGNIW